MAELAQALAKAAARRAAAPPPSSAKPAASALASDASLAAGIASERERNARLRACDINAWYERLRPVTFRTSFLPLSPEEAKAMIAAYWHKARGTAIAEPERHAALLDALKQRIATAMAELTGPGGRPGVFAKLSSRSPKDSRFCEARALEQVKERLTQVRAAHGAVHMNDVVCACIGCGIEALRLASADEVLECFTTSDRVCADDLPLALEFPASWAQFLVLREWVTIPSHHEFRAFVVGNRLTGLSQYFDTGYYPELVANKARLLALIQRFFEDQVRDRAAMHPADYVVDFAVDQAGERAYVIEVNPFGPPDGYGTGTPLFDLRNDRDRAILFGQAPFEFRICEAPPSDASVAKLLREGSLRTWLIEQNMLPK